ncbi:MAG: 5-carboxymethyl-2-hydroxymuconate delta-isomerase [Polaromonas sp.]|nr:5-carboxymethyl-2-hydroxymuconate delta-isomerase [Polaromonas sp.]
MKLCRFNDNRLGFVEGDEVFDVTPALQALPALRYPFPVGEQLVTHLRQAIKAIRALAPSAQGQPLARVSLLAPVANPGKIIAAPVNHVKHLKEVLGDPGLHHGNQINHIERAGLFLKANSSLTGAGEGVTLALPERRTDREIELVVVIDKTARNVAAADALAHVAGYCIGLDITIRGPEERSFRKSPDSYTVLGPWLTTADEIADPGQLITAREAERRVQVLENWGLRGKSAITRHADRLGAA